MIKVRRSPFDSKQLNREMKYSRKIVTIKFVISVSLDFTESLRIHVEFNINLIPYKTLEA